MKKISLALLMLASASLLFAQQRAIYWNEDFEGTASSWTVSAGTWEIGIPTSGPNGAHGGTKCAATVLTGNYTEGVDSRLISAAIDIPDDSQNPRLRFWQWYSISSGDYGKVQIKIAGESVWLDLSGSYINTGSGTWTSPSIDLSTYAGQSVQFAFYFHSHQVYSSPGVSSGWYIDDISVVTGPVVFNNPETWEGGLGDWGAEKGTWEVGIPTSGPGAAHGGTKCAGTKLAGSYDEGVDSRLISPVYTIPAANQNPRLRFWQWYNNSTGDYGQVQIKPTGSTTWVNLAGDYVNTGSGTWTSPSIDLSTYAGQSVQFAFYFHSHQVYSYAGVNSGWYIDDISVVTGPVVFNNPETWESGLGDWGAEKGTWEVGIPTSGPGAAHTSIFLEEFTSSLSSFTTYNVSGSQTWSWASYDGGCSQMSGYSTGTYYPNEDWLISPAISLIGHVGATLNFREAINYITSISDLKVLISTDYDGISSPAVSGSWTELTGFIRAPGNNWTFVNSGEVSLSSFENHIIHIAFKYMSSSTAAATWELSKVEVKSGQKCAATVLAGNYDEGVDSRLTSPVYIVPAASQKPKLQFWHWYNMSSGDYGKIQIKIGGSSTWIDFTEQFTNMSCNTWIYQSFDLSNYSGQSVQFAFYFHSHQVYSSPGVSSGWYIDDVGISTIQSMIKTLNINVVYLEGLYLGGGVMRKAQDANGDKFPGNTADQITIELHNSCYSSIAYSIPNVDLSTTGIAPATIYGDLQGSYYIAIKHRNSITTTSAAPVSFAGSTITYNFSSASSQAYGNNLKLIGNKYVIYGGDIDQDGVVDSGDMIDVDNNSANFAIGYLATDVNGDGLVDSGDMIIVDNNSGDFISYLHP